MAIPTSSLYPDNFDSNDNLFLVHDSLRMQLSDDYAPGDTSITVIGDSIIMSRFPDSGLITLTDQCNDLDKRALSFFYSSKTDTTFDGLEILPYFTDVAKPKLITNVTQNVMAKHHNHLKDALIAIEEFLGVEGTCDVRPLGDTITGRLCFLKKLVLAPKAWFTADKTLGVIPLTVTFTDKSFRSPTYWEWDFDDGSNPSVCTSYTDEVPISVTGCVIDPDGGSITKTFTTPDSYDITLKVSNKYGTDEIVFPNFIIARVIAPDPAEIVINPSKARINTLIGLEVTDNGEQQDGMGNPIDPIVEYTWDLGDDLLHNNSPTTSALYSVGGIYDVKLRTDTQLNAYRITTKEDVINIVESINLWMINFDSPKSNLDVTKTAYTYEFGLISETFKTATMPLSVTRDHTFIDGTYDEVDYQINLFRTNNGFAPRSLTTSGDKGRSMVYWAEESDLIRFKEYRPFDEVWATPTIGGGDDTLSRNWNWVGLNTPNDINIVFGVDTVEPNPTDVSQQKDSINLFNLNVSSSTFTGANYLNGADELTTNPDSYPSTYKSTWHLTNGYILRNSAGPGAFFRLFDFYRTEGTSAVSVQNFRKLASIPGSIKLEGELTSLNAGIFFFNNTGEVSIYNTISDTWSIASPSAGSSSFSSLQDSSVEGFSETDQPLKLASDKDRRAYLSFDYSPNAFIKFNESDLTFSSLPTRPNGEQFIMGIY